MEVVKNAVEKHLATFVISKPGETETLTKMVEALIFAYSFCSNICFMLFSFAVRVFLGSANLSLCPHLPSKRIIAIIANCRLLSQRDFQKCSRKEIQVLLSTCPVN